jgi:hypothetical protein
MMRDGKEHLVGYFSIQVDEDSEAPFLQENVARISSELDIGKTMTSKSNRGIFIKFVSSIPLSIWRTRIGRANPTLRCLFRPSDGNAPLFEFLGRFDRTRKSAFQKDRVKKWIFQISMECSVIGPWFLKHRSRKVPMAANSGPSES